MTSPLPSPELLYFRYIVLTAVVSVLETASEMPHPDPEGILALARAVAVNAAEETEWEQVCQAASEFGWRQNGADPPANWREAFASVLYDRTFDALRTTGFLL